MFFYFNLIFKLIVVLRRRKSYISIEDKQHKRQQNKQKNERNLKHKNPYAIPCILVTVEHNRSRGHAIRTHVIVHVEQHYNASNTLDHCITRQQFIKEEILT